MPFSYNTPRVSPQDMTPIDYGAEERKKLGISLADMIRSKRAGNIQMEAAQMKLAEMKRNQADQLAFRQALQPVFNPQQNQMFNAGLASAGAPPVPMAQPNLEQAMNMLLQQGNIAGYEQLAQAKQRMTPKPVKPLPDQIMSGLLKVTDANAALVMQQMVKNGTMTPEEAQDAWAKRMEMKKTGAATGGSLAERLVGKSPEEQREIIEFQQQLNPRVPPAPIPVKTTEGMVFMDRDDIPRGSPIPNTKETDDQDARDKEARTAILAGFVKSAKEWDAVPREEQIKAMATEEWLRAERAIAKKTTPTAREDLDKGFDLVKDQIKLFVTKDPFYKAFREKQISLAPIEEASAGLLAFYENPSAPGMENYSAAVDGMTLLFSFVRNLDNSVVRPGEIAILDAMRGIVGDLEAKYGRNFGNMPLQANDVKRIVDQARKTTEAIRHKAGDAWKGYKNRIPKMYRDIPEVGDYLESQFQDTIEFGSPPIPGSTQQLYNEDFQNDLDKLGGY